MPETIFLDTMDGFGFEQACERIFSKAGWGKVTRLGGVADGGRDLIIETPNGEKIIVECKFYAGTVGRPIVQKLHSAVITSHADRGIVITTGRFSPAAVKHAKSLTADHHPMELYDMHKLVELAHEAGIELKSGQSNTIYSYKVFEPDDIRRMVLESIKVQSHPKQVSDIITVSKTRVSMRAMYLISASIHQTFKTSVGVIHEISINDDISMFEGQHGLMDALFDVSFFGKPTMTMSELPQTLEYEKTGFEMDSTTLKNAAIDQLMDKHSTEVRYSGNKNSRVYEKLCVPNRRNIHLDDIKQVYVPSYEITLAAGDNRHSCELLVNRQKKKIIQRQTWNKCKECESEKNLLLCNECGKIVHCSMFRSHGFKCRKCEKTICLECVWSSRWLLFFMNRFCSDCKTEKDKQ